MKYLDSKFSVYMGSTRGSKDPFKKYRSSTPADRPDTKHEYQDIGGMCRQCALDQIGHDTKMEKLHGK